MVTNAYAKDLARYARGRPPHLLRLRRGSTAPRGNGPRTRQRRGGRAVDDLSRAGGRPRPRFAGGLPGSNNSRTSTRNPTESRDTIESVTLPAAFSMLWKRRVDIPQRSDAISCVQPFSSR